MKKYEVLLDNNNIAEEGEIYAKVRDVGRNKEINIKFRDLQKVEEVIARDGIAKSKVTDKVIVIDRNKTIKISRKTLEEKADRYKNNIVLIPADGYIKMRYMGNEIEIDKDFPREFLKTTAIKKINMKIEKINFAEKYPLKVFQEYCKVQIPEKGIYDVEPRKIDLVLYHALKMLKNRGCLINMIDEVYKIEAIGVDTQVPLYKLVPKDAKNERKTVTILLKELNIIQMLDVISMAHKIEDKTNASTQITEKILFQIKPNCLNN